MQSKELLVEFVPPLFDAAVGVRERNWNRNRNGKESAKFLELGPPINV